MEFSGFYLLMSLSTTWGGANFSDERPRFRLVYRFKAAVKVSHLGSVFYAVLWLRTIMIKVSIYEQITQEFDHVAGNSTVGVAHS